MALSSSMTRQTFRCWAARFMSLSRSTGFCSPTSLVILRDGRTFLFRSSLGPGTDLCTVFCNHAPSSPHFALFLTASASLLVASSSNAVSTAAEGRCTYRTTEPRMNMSRVEHYTLVSQSTHSTSRHAVPQMSTFLACAQNCR